MAELFLTKYKNHYEPRVRHQQSFDRTKIHVIKCGQKINVYDAIQEAGEDTDIYKTLEKYGSIENMHKHNKEAIQAEFDDYLTLADIHEQAQAAENMWKRLPAGVREQFKNDKYDFLKNGEKWLQDSIKKHQEKQNKEKNQEGVNNG